MQPGWKQLERGQSMFSVTKPRQVDSPKVFGVGCWVDQDPLEGPVANVLYRVDTRRMRPGMDAASKPMAFGLSMMGIEVRFGILVRPAEAASLTPWIDAHVPGYRDEASRISTALGQVGIRDIEQYLWLRLPEPTADFEHDWELTFKALQAFAASVLDCTELRVESSSMVARAQLSMAERTDLPGRGVAGESLGSITTYLQKGGNLQEASTLVEAITSVAPREAFSVWMTLSSVKAGRSHQVTKSFESNVVWCQFQLTLHDVSLRTEHEVRALLLGMGLDFRRPSKLRWLGGPAAKSFAEPVTRLMQAVPLCPIAAPNLKLGGVLLRSALHTPVTLNIFEGSTFQNVAIVGRPGSECAAFPAAVLAAHIGQGNPAWLIADGCRDDVLRQLAGRAAEVRKIEAGLNLLSQCSTEEDLQFGLDWLCALIGGDALSDYARSRLQDALWRAWLKGPCALGLADVRFELEQMYDFQSEELALRLMPFTGEGPYAHFFEGPPLELGTDSLLVLDTQAFAGEMESVLSLTVLALLNLHWRKLAFAETRPRFPAQKMVFFGPAGHWTHRDVTPWLLVELCRIQRSARLLNGAVMTQLFMGSSNVPELTTVLMQHSAYQVLLPVRQVSVSMAECLGDDTQKRWMRLHPGRGPGMPMLIQGPHGLKPVTWVTA